MYILDTEGSNLILYIAIPSTKKTMIAILSVSSSVPGHLMLKNVKTFNQDNTNSSGLDGFDIIKKPKTIQPNAIPNQPSLQGTNYIQDTNSSIVKQDENNSSIPSLDSVIANYYKTYWNENQSLVPTTNIVNQRNDFLLTNDFKTSDSSRVSTESLIFCM